VPIIVGTVSQHLGKKVSGVNTQTSWERDRGQSSVMKHKTMLAGSCCTLFCLLQLVRSASHTQELARPVIPSTHSALEASSHALDVQIRLDYHCNSQQLAPSGMKL
jgi:hypothetical protein